MERDMVMSEPHMDYQTSTHPQAQLQERVVGQMHMNNQMREQQMAQSLRQKGMAEMQQGN